MNCSSLRYLLPTAVAVLLAAPTPARADRTIGSDFTQNGGTFSVSPASTLYVDDATLTLNNAATTTGINALSVQEGGTMNVYGGSKVNVASDVYWGASWPDPYKEYANTVNVVGSGSRLAAGGSLHLGWSGNNGVLNIREGGEVTSGGISFLGGYYWGYEGIEGFPLDISGTGVVNVTDSGSRWIANQIWIGYDIGSGTLNITNGGLVTSTSATIENLLAYWVWPPSEQSSASVTGAGSRWETGTLRVGAPSSGYSNDYGGSLKVEEDGLVAVGSSLVVGKNGIVDVHDNGLIVVGEATGELGAVVVGADGILSGTGKIIGDVINAGGLVSPGYSPGTLTIDGDYAQLADGTLLLEIGGATPALFDQLVVTGDLTLAGLVQIDLVNGFVPQVGDQFQLFTVGGTTDLSGVAYEWLNVPAGLQIDGNLLDGTLTITAVPEPSTLVLAGVATLFAVATCRRRVPRRAGPTAVR